MEVEIISGENTTDEMQSSFEAKVAMALGHFHTFKKGE